MICKKNSDLSFRKLKPRPGTFLAVFFPFFNPGITLDKTGSFQCQSKIRVDDNKCSGNTVPNGIGLAGNTAADNRCFNVIGTECIG
jgi:hypothetical protein